MESNIEDTYICLLAMLPALSPSSIIELALFPLGPGMSGVLERPLDIVESSCEGGGVISREESPSSPVLTEFPLHQSYNDKQVRHQINNYMRLPFSLSSRHSTIW